MTKRLNNDTVSQQHMMWNSWSFPLSPPSVQCPGQAGPVLWSEQLPVVTGQSGSPGQAGPQHPDSHHNTQLMLLMLSFCIFTSVFIQCTKNNGKCLNKEPRVSAVYLSGEKSLVSRSCWRALCTPGCLRLLSKQSSLTPLHCFLSPMFQSINFVFSLITKRIKYHWVINKISLGVPCVCCFDHWWYQYGWLWPTESSSRAS